MNNEIRIGQELYIVPTHGNGVIDSYGRDIRKGTVTKITRKYLYVKIEGVHGLRDHIFDGIRFCKEESHKIWCYESEEPDNGWRAFRSKQEIRDREEADGLLYEFSEFFSWGSGTHSKYELTLEQLRSIKTILERGKS